MFEDFRAKYVVVDERIDEMLDLLTAPAMTHEPLGNVQEELKAIGAEIERLRTISRPPKVSPEDQLRLNLLLATGLNPNDKAGIKRLAERATMTPKELTDILTGAQSVVSVGVIARLATALGTHAHVLLKEVA